MGPREERMIPDRVIEMLSGPSFCRSRPGTKVCGLRTPYAVGGWSTRTARL